MNPRRAERAMSLDQKIRAECKTFVGGFRSLLLGTLDKADEAELSYAPFVDLDGNFFVLISGLSAHTGNLIRHPVAQVMFIDDESAVEQIYARRRLRFSCNARQCTRDDKEWQMLLPQFHERFGDIVKTLTALPDFQLFCLTPLHGNWVKGFGKAFEFEGANYHGAALLNPARTRR